MGPISTLGCQCPIASLTNYHKLGGLKQHKFIISQCGGQEARTGPRVPAGPCGREPISSLFLLAGLPAVLDSWSCKLWPLLLLLHLLRFSSASLPLIRTLWLVAITHFNSFNIIPYAKSLLTCKKHIHRLYGLEYGHIWGILFCLPHPIRFSQMTGCSLDSI